MLEFEICNGAGDVWQTVQVQRPKGAAAETMAENLLLDYRPYLGDTPEVRGYVVHPDGSRVEVCRVTEDEGIGFAMDFDSRGRLTGIHGRY